MVQGRGFYGASARLGFRLLGWAERLAGLRVDAGGYRCTGPWVRCSADGLRHASVDRHCGQGIPRIGSGCPWRIANDGGLGRHIFLRSGLSHCRSRHQHSASHNDARRCESGSDRMAIPMFQHGFPVPQFPDFARSHAFRSGESRASSSASTGRKPTKCPARSMKYRR